MRNTEAVPHYSIVTLLSSAKIINSITLAFLWYSSPGPRPNSEHDGPRFLFCIPNLRGGKSSRHGGKLGDDFFGRRTMMERKK